MQLSDLNGKRVVMWGAAREAQSVIEAMRRLEIDAHVEVVEDGDGTTETLAGVPILRHSAMVDALAAADVVVKSPSISRYRPDVTALRVRGVIVTTATELWFAEGFQNVIGITGTKGKSTTASLVAHLLGAVGADVALTGNIGRAPIDLLGRSTPDWWVVELSSYQTSGLTRSPKIGVLTSLSPEHLDWHGDEETYRRDKLNLFANDPAAVVIVNVADHGARAAADGILAEVVRANEAPAGRVKDGCFWIGDLKVAPIEAFRLLGRHNHEIAGVALSVLAAAGIDIEMHCRAIARGLSTFEPLAHRLEVFAEVDGITYVDDSISTTPAATLAALDAFKSRPVTVLVGGHDRGLSYDELAEYLVSTEGRVGVVALPDSGPRIIEAMNTAGSAVGAVQIADDVNHAVRIAAESTDPGGVVLLSPGAASFGRFRDYIERGNVFRAAVDQMKSKS